MNFCPKCGSIMLPDKTGKKRLVCTNCRNVNIDVKDAVLKENISKREKVEVVDRNIEVDPKTEADCPKCGNKEAYYWTVQTRAADEPETRFFKCTKCEHQWREYS
jgi:transcription factor S